MRWEFRPSRSEFQVTAMNSEDAFVQAIRNDPLDAALKLVFADWLEERADPRSEFLRLEVELSQTDESHDQYESVRARHRTAFEKCDPSWAQQVGFLYDVILEGYFPSLKINTIKQIREATGLGLKEIKDIAESVPAAITKNVSRWEAERIQEHVEVDDTGWTRSLRDPIKVPSGIRPGKISRVRIQLSERS